MACGTHGECATRLEARLEHFSLRHLSRPRILHTPSSLASTRALWPRACKCGDGDSRSDARSKSAVPMINALSMINSDRINALSVVVHADPFLRKHGGARLHCDGAWQSRLPPHSGERRTRSRCAGAAQHHLSSIEAAALCAWPVHINLRTWCIR